MKVPLRTISREKHLEVPPGGWMPHALYYVHVAMSKHNPVFPAVLFSGYLQNGKPAGYSCVWVPGSRETITIQDLWYLEIVKDLGLDFNPMVGF